MYARVVRFTDVTPERIEEIKTRIEESDGPPPGVRSTGIQLFFDRYPDGEFADTEVMVAGDRGAAEWTFRASGDDGEPFELRGCDLFEFDGDLIKTKNAFRKVRETLD